MRAQSFALPLLFGAAASSDAHTALPSPPCYSPLNPAFETPCYSTVAQEGVFSLRDYAGALDVTVVTTIDPTPSLYNGAMNVLTYFTGTNIPGINVTRTVPIFFRARDDGGEFYASMALPTSIYIDPSIAPIPQFPNNMPGFQPFPKARFAAITFQAATLPGILDFAYACGELGEEIQKRGLTPIGPSPWNTTWATYSQQASTPTLNECLIEVEAV
jgi:hypothetical protein